VRVDSLLTALVSPAFGAEADTFTFPTDVPEKGIPTRPPIGARLDDAVRKLGGTP
jgi:hypothetical protein